MGFSDFEILRKVGKGSFGSVYKVKRKSDGLEYAMKKVSIRDLKHREKEDAINEIRMLASFQHDNVIRYCEAFLHKDNLIIVTEYAQNGDLGDKIEKAKASRRPLKEDTIWSYFLQICYGLQALHNKKILHRDLKPKNIFLSSNDCVKLGDLGCSKVLKGVGLAKTQVGTPYYMSPELWMRKPYNDKSDMWALGCMLFEMMALQPPYLAGDMNELGQKVRFSAAPRSPAGYSSDLQQLVQRLLSKDPRYRPSVRELLSLPLLQRRQHLAPAPGGGRGAGGGTPCPSCTPPSRSPVSWVFGMCPSVSRSRHTPPPHAAAAAAAAAVVAAVGGGCVCPPPH